MFVDIGDVFLQDVPITPAEVQNCIKSFPVLFSDVERFDEILRYYEHYHMLKYL